MSETALYNEVMRAAYYALRAAKKAGADEEDLQDLLADGACPSFRLIIRPHPFQQSHVSNKRSQLSPTVHSVWRIAP